MNDRSRPKAAPEGSGGPQSIVAVDPVIAPFLASEVCECREATLLRMIASGELPLPGSGSFKTLASLVRASAIRKLRQMSHDLSEGGKNGASWASGTSYAEIERRRSEVVIPPWAEKANARLARRRGEAE